MPSIETRSCETDAFAVARVARYAEMTRLVIDDDDDDDVK